MALFLLLLDDLWSEIEGVPLLLREFSRSLRLSRSRSLVRSRLRSSDMCALDLGVLGMEAGGLVEGARATSGMTESARDERREESM